MPSRPALRRAIIAVPFFAAIGLAASLASGRNRRSSDPQAFGQPATPLAIAVQQNLRVGMIGDEHVAQRRQFSAQFLVIVNFAVERDHQIAADHRLRAAFEIDDGKTPVAEKDAGSPLNPCPLRIRAAMGADAGQLLRSIFAKAALQRGVHTFCATYLADNRPVADLVELVKAREYDGYAYDGAEASFELLASIWGQRHNEGTPRTCSMASFILFP